MTGWVSMLIGIWQVWIYTEKSVLVINLHCLNMNQEAKNTLSFMKASITSKSQQFHCVSSVKSYHHLLPMSSAAPHFCSQSTAVIYCNSPGSEIFTKKDPKRMT